MSDFLTALGPSDYDPATPPEPEAPGFLDSVRAGFSAARAGADWGGNQARYEAQALDPIRRAAERRGFRPTFRPAASPYGGPTLGQAQDRETDDLLGWVARERQRDAGFLPQYRHITDRRSLRADAVKRRQDDADRAARDGAGGSTIGSFAGMIGAGFLDPISYLPVGGGVAKGASVARQILGTALREGAANAAVAVATEPLVRDDAALLGEERTMADTVADVAAQGLTGGAIGAGAKSVELLSRRFRRAVPAARRTPDEQDALIVQEQDEHGRGSSPFMAGGAGMDVHGPRLKAAHDALASEASPRPPAPRRAANLRPARDAIIAGIIHVESRGRPDAISPKGAMGRMQVMPATARRPGHGIRPAADDGAAELERVGRELYGALDRKYGGDPVLALAAYNAGEGNVDKWLKTIGDPRTGAISSAEFARRIPFRETRNYVPDVLSRAGGDLPDRPIVRRELFADVAHDIDPPAPGERADAVASRPDPFGPSHPDLTDDWAGAVARLSAERDGVVPAALWHPDIGEIDVPWGAEGSGKGNGFGLAKLVRHHPEVVDDLPAIIAGMEVTTRSGNRVRLETPDHLAGISLEWKGDPSSPWLLTAYEKADAPPPAVDTRAGDGGQDGSPAPEAAPDIGDRPVVDKFRVEPSGYPDGSWKVVDADGRPLVGKAHIYGETPKRYRTREAAMKAAPKLVPLRDPAAVRDAVPDIVAAERFDAPGGEGDATLIGSLEHDVEMLAGAGDLDPESRAELDALDDEARAIAAVEACMKPKGKTK